MAAAAASQTGMSVKEFADFMIRQGFTNFEDVKISFQRLVMNDEVKDSKLDNKDEITTDETNHLQFRCPLHRCFKETEVQFKGWKGQKGKAIFHANWVNDTTGKRAYICSESPMSSAVNDTRPHFWQMVLKSKVQTIVMLTQFELPPSDQSMASQLCARYWPDKVGDSVTYDKVTVKLIKEDKTKSFVESTLKVRSPECEEREVRHLWLADCPVIREAQNQDALMELLSHCYNLPKEKDSPMLVHCWSGVIATGIFVTLDVIYRALMTDKEAARINIEGLVSELRRQRHKMVLKEENFVFCHVMALKCAKKLQLV